MRRHWRPDMPALLPPSTMRQCPASSRSFLRGPDGPYGGSTWTSPALRRSYRAQETAGQSKIRITKVSTVSGEPRADEKIAQDDDFLASIGGGHCQPELAPGRS